MQKLHIDFQPASPGVGGMKLDSSSPSVETALGDILEVHSTPELERKVLRKIDAM